MQMRWILTVLLSIGIFFTSVQSAMALPLKENKQLNNEVEKGKDSIEWVALWDFPKTREGQLERILTTELQRRTLFALQENKYLLPGKEHV
jgi:hypothetical protein